MLTNLIVVDPKHLDENGEPNPNAIIFNDRIIVHPNDKDKLYEMLIAVFDKEQPPIVISSDEWDSMKKFSKILENPKTQSTFNFVSDEYRYFWSAILKRALEEADVHHNSSKKSESKETPTISGQDNK